MVAASAPATAYDGSLIPTLQVILCGEIRVHGQGYGIDWLAPIAQEFQDLSEFPTALARVPDGVGEQVTMQGIQLVHFIQVGCHRFGQQIGRSREHALLENVSSWLVIRHTVPEQVLVAVEHAVRGGGGQPIQGFIERVMAGVDVTDPAQ